MTGPHHDEDTPLADPLTPEVAHALENLDIPVPQPIDESLYAPGAEELILTPAQEVKPRWRVPTPGLDGVPDDVAEAARAAGCTVVNSDEDLRLYVEARGYALVPLDELGQKDGAFKQIEILANFLLAAGYRIEDGGAGDNAIRILQEQADEIARLTAKRFTIHVDSLKVGKSDGINPKDALGMKKPNLSLVPPASSLYQAHAMMDGAQKYGPYNWRSNPVLAMVYIAAAQRHLAQYLDGENIDPISGVPHLGHALACLGILADATETGNLVDDRPIKGAASGMIRRFNDSQTFVR